MKVLVEVSGADQAHSHAQSQLPVVTMDNLDDLLSFSQGADYPLACFLGPDVPPSSVYKMIEDYAGPMTMYCTTQASDVVLLSRFQKVVSMVQRTRTDFSLGETYTRVAHLKSQVSLRYT